MKKIKVGSAVLFFLIAGGLAIANNINVRGEGLLNGKVIALDAGHGFEGAVGAVGYCEGKSVFEVNVNLTVRDNLKSRLEEQGATVFLVPQLETRKERVAEAEEAGADILISIHHNGSGDTTADYTETFITQTKYDKPLAEFIHPALVTELNLSDHGITNSGFGMTVFGDHPAVLTEAYFITNTNAACDYLGDQERLQAEVRGLYSGIMNYFLSVDVANNPLQKSKQ